MGMATIDDEAMEPEVTEAREKPLRYWPEYIHGPITGARTKHYYPYHETGLKPTPKVKRKCKADQGERTNRKLKDQPYYQRGRKGKPKGY